MSRPARKTELVAALAGLVAVLAVAIWLVSPRFEIESPSVIDDWWGVKNSPAAFDALMRFEYSPAAADDASRYRPAFTAVWNELQWHTLGAPQSMTGPNIWNVVRIAILLSGLTALTFCLLLLVPERFRARGCWLGLLSVVPAALLLATPSVIVTLSRFGPQEPLMLGSMALGGVALVAALRLSFAPLRVWRSSAIAALAIVGYGFWMFGAYSKEVSIGALALLPCLVVVMGARWREIGLVDGSLLRYRRTWIGVVVMSLPLIQIGFESARRAGDGPLYSTAPAPVGIAGWSTAFGDAIHDGLVFMPQHVGDGRWMYLLAALPFFVASTMVWRRRIDWNAIGLIACGLAIWTFQGLSGTWDARYYVPSLALAAVTALIATPLSSRRLAPVVVIASAVLLVVSLPARHAQSLEHVEDLRQVDAALRAAEKLDAGRCPVYLDDMNVELASAWPTLAALRPTSERRSCDARFAAMMIGFQGSGGATNPAIDEACQSPGWLTVEMYGPVRFSGCRKFRDGRLVGRQGGGQFVADVLRWNRLEPGWTIAERLADPSRGPFCRVRACRKQLIGMGGE